MIGNPTELIAALMKMSSNVHKEEFIRQNKNNDRFMELLYFALNPYIQFYIRKLPEYPNDIKILYTSVEAYREFVRLAQKLMERKLTGNAARDEVARIFGQMLPEEREIYEKVLTKAAVGVGAKTVNKALGNSQFKIPVFDVLLAPNEIPDISKLKYPLLASPKMDGFRCVFWPQKGSAKFFSRYGRVYENQKLLDHFKALNGLNRYVLDGELYIHGIGFNKLNSILTTEDADIPKELKFIVFDCIDISQWEKQNCKDIYEDRLKTLRQVITSQVADHTKIIDVATDVCETSKEVKDLYKKYTDKGYEGLMLRNPNALYQWKRPSLKANVIMKLKPVETHDVKIKGYYDGEGNLTGSLGGVIVDFNGVDVKVGSGLTIDERTEIWNNRDKYIGTYIEVKYMEITEDGSMRHPVFIRFRKDKNGT